MIRRLLNFWRRPEPSAWATQKAAYDRALARRDTRAIHAAELDLRAATNEALRRELRKRRRNQ